MKTYVNDYIEIIRASLFGMRNNTVSNPDKDYKQGYMDAIQDALAICDRLNIVIGEVDNALQKAYRVR